MHVPDGFLDAPTSLATGAVAVAAVGVSLVKARHELDDKTAPMAGLVAAFVFAVQMLNFPVGVGTSGHLMGGALAAVLVGPWTGILCLSVVFVVQCLLFPPLAAIARLRGYRASYPEYLSATSGQS